MAKNAVPTTGSGEDVAARVARETFDKRGPDYTGEVRRLLDAGLAEMRRCGTQSRPRVADIVAAAGLSNDAFYRHFPSKDALVAAILEDGTQRLGDYVAHQMGKARSPGDQVRRWVAGVMAQADDDIAATTLAVLWNAGAGRPGAPGSAAGPIAVPLQPALRALGSTAPELDATLVAHACVGRLGQHLYAGTTPGADEVEHLVAFALATATARVDGADPASPE